MNDSQRVAAHVQEFVTVYSNQNYPRSMPLSSSKISECEYRLSRTRMGACSRINKQRRDPCDYQWLADSIVKASFGAQVIVRPWRETSGVKFQVDYLYPLNIMRGCRQKIQDLNAQWVTVPREKAFHATQ